MPANLAKGTELEPLEFLAGTPIELGPARRAEFRKLVIAAGEVASDVLSTNIAEAKALVFLVRSGALQAIAALKRPRASYRNRITDATGTAISETAFPYELGYIYVLPDAQGQRLSHVLVAAALEYSDRAGVFATVRADNVRMLRTLARASFDPAGEPYPGRGDRTIRLMVRPVKATS